MIGMAALTDTERMIVDTVSGFHWSLRGQPDFRGAGIRAD